MKLFFIAITIISAILLVVVILLQQGKGADLGSAFGRGAQGGLFTTSGKGNFLTHTTAVLMFIFLTSCLVLSLFLGDSQQDGVLQQLEQTAPADNRDLESSSEQIPE